MTDRTAALAGWPPRKRHRAFDALTITDAIATRIRWAARVWVIIAVSVFVVQGLRTGAPSRPDYGNWQQPAQFALLALVALGGLLAWRWEAPGATIIVVGAISIGVLAAVERVPSVAFLNALVFLVPGILFWFVWQRTKPLRDVFALALGLLLLLGAGGLAASYCYNQTFGSNAPRSTMTALPVTLVDWVWSGAATDSSIVVKARLVRDSDAVQLLVSRQPDLAGAITSEPVVARQATNDGVVTFEMNGLTPDTDYYYAVRAGNEVDRSRLGEFHTFASGPSSFSFAFGSCIRTGSNSSVFETIRGLNPRFFLQFGDLFYGDVSVNDPVLYRSFYEYQLTSPSLSALLRSVPVTYVWDDHDFGTNDSDRTSPGRDAAHHVYRELVPHYPLATSDTAAIYQAFTVGRVRFIITDTRSARSPKTDKDDADKTMLGVEQKAWFKHELLTAKDNYPVIVWVNSLPWIDSAGAGKDTWGGYSTERRELADFIADNEISGLVMLSGDAHLLAIDDGSNSDYSTDGGAGFVVMQASALDNIGSIKGGPYSEGFHIGGGQFGMMTVTDDGGSTIQVTLVGYNWRGRNLIDYRFTVPVPAEP